LETDISFLDRQNRRVHVSSFSTHQVPCLLFRSVLRGVHFLEGLLEDVPEIRPFRGALASGYGLPACLCDRGQGRELGELKEGIHG
jgi:hypothetical protein